MSSEAMLGYGTLFKVWDDRASPPAYVTLGEVKTVTPPQATRDTPEVTHTESPNSYREFKGGLIDPGTAGGTVNFIPGSTTTGLMLYLLTKQDPVPCRVEWPDSPATIWDFPGILTDFSPDAPLDDVMTATFSFKVSGEPDYLAASP